MTVIESLSKHPPPSPVLNNITPLKTTGNEMTAKNQSLFGDNGFTFFDFLDIINPLQHIPIISNIYRSITGDEIDPGSKIAGAAIFGGPVGGVLASMDLVISRKTGQDLAGHAATFFTTGGNTKTTLNLEQKNARVDQELSNFTKPIKPIHTDGHAVPSVNVKTSPLKDSVELDSTNKFGTAGMTAIPIARVTFVPLMQTSFGLQTNLGGSDPSTKNEQYRVEAGGNDMWGKEPQYNKIDNIPFRAPVKTSPQKTTRVTNNQPKPVPLDNLTKFQNQRPINESKTYTNKHWVIDAMLTGLDKYNSTITLTNKPHRKQVFIDH